MKSNCEFCVNYRYDYDEEMYVCDKDLDQDEMYLFIADKYDNCPYYQQGDEYKIVNKQI